MLVELDELEALDLQNKCFPLDQQIQSHIVKKRNEFLYFHGLYQLFPSTLNRLRFSLAKDAYFEAMKTVTL